MREQVVKEIKIRWWNTKLKIYHKKINRRKYYGVKTLIEQYKDLIVEAYAEPIESIFGEISTKEKYDIEEIIILALSDIQFPSIEVNEILEKAFERGARRVFTKKGETIKAGQITNYLILRNLQYKQQQYFKDLGEDLIEKIFNILEEGVRKGKSIFDMKEEISQKTKEISEVRASRIARSEVIRASAEGTRQGMREAGIEKYIWLTARDNRVCSVCRKLDGLKFETRNEDSPLPVRDSHPNCRCVLVADI